MSRVQEIEAAMQKLSAAELAEVREWLENFIEDHLEMNEAFTAGIEESRELFKKGIMPRVRRP